MLDIPRISHNQSTQDEPQNRVACLEHECLLLPRLRSKSARRPQYDDGRHSRICFTRECYANASASDLGTHTESAIEALKLDVTAVHILFPLRLEYRRVNKLEIGCSYHRMIQRLEK